MSSKIAYKVSDSEICNYIYTNSYCNKLVNGNTNSNV